MQLALFTPGAYIWPVHRSFEAFIAGLAAPSSGAATIAGSATYPAACASDSLLTGLTEGLDRRLQELHRALFDALLRPTTFFAGSQVSFVEYFMPDLAGTSVEHLLSAFSYYMVRRPVTALSVNSALSILRAAFFSHESAEPALWLHSCLLRLAAERAETARLELRFTAPRQTRVNDLAFSLVTDLKRPWGGPAWVVGRIRRSTDGSVQISAGCGLDPSADCTGAAASIRDILEADLRYNLGLVFGWGEQAA